MNRATNELFNQLLSHDFTKSWIGPGPEQIFDNLSTMSKFTGMPYDIIKISDTTYVLEVACAGFGKEELKVELVNDTIKISGSRIKKPQEYQWHGISKKDFVLPLTITEGYEVGAVSFKDGMLRIVIELKPLPAAKLLNIVGD